MEEKTELILKYKDKHGTITESKFTYDIDDSFTTEFDTIIDKVKLFLLSCDFTQELIDRRIK